MISIVDYGMGNLGSIQNMLKKIGAESCIVSDEEGINKSEKLILPGVGHFDRAMSRIENSGLKAPLTQRVMESKVPVLGICLGMQIMTNGSEEGKLPGFGWISGKSVRFQPDNPSIKVPHMGWNMVERVNSSPLTNGFDDDETRFYFVHSYHIVLEKSDEEMFRCVHGIKFTAAFCKGNIFGVQFHPEKSHRFGKQLLANFAAI